MGDASSDAGVPVDCTEEEAPDAEAVGVMCQLSNSDLQVGAKAATSSNQQSAVIFANL